MFCSSLEDETLIFGLRKKLYQSKEKFPLGLLFYDRPKIVRHNCASIIYYLLQAGGFENQITDFNESTYINSALSNMIHYRRKTDPNLSQNTSKIKLAGYFSLFINTFNSKGSPITAYFGATPEVISKMVIHLNDSSSIKLLNQSPT